MLAEALDSVASPEMRTRIFDRALAVGGLDAVPEGGRELLDFVDAYFRAAVVSCLGEALADEVIAQVEPIVRMASRSEPISEVRVIEPSGRRDTPPYAMEPGELDRPPEREDTPTLIPSERATARAPEDFAAMHVSIPKASKAPSDVPPLELEPLEDEPLEDPRSWVDLADDGDDGDDMVGPSIDLGRDRPHSEAPDFPDVVELAMTPGPLAAVLFVTPLSFLVKPFAAGLGELSTVRHIVDGIDILDGLREHAVLSMVVLDCRTHDVDVATIASLLTDCDPLPLLVLWGATEAMIDEVALASDDLRCLTVDEAAGVKDLAARCLAAGA